MVSLFKIKPAVIYLGNAYRHVGDVKAAMELHKTVVDIEWVFRLDFQMWLTFKGEYWMRVVGLSWRATDLISKWSRWLQSAYGRTLVQTQFQVQTPSIRPPKRSARTMLVESVGFFIETNVVRRQTMAGPNGTSKYFDFFTKICWNSVDGMTFQILF